MCSLVVRLPLLRSGAGDLAAPAAGMHLCVGGLGIYPTTLAKARVVPRVGLGDHLMVDEQDGRQKAASRSLDRHHSCVLVFVAA